MLWQERTQTTERSINNKISTEKIYITLITIKQKINYFSDAQNKAHHIINTLLEEAWNEINKDQANSSTKSKKHLSLDYIIKNQYLTKSFSFAYLCQKFSLSHEFELIRTVTLIISFKELLLTWLTEFSFCTDHSHSLKTKSKIYVAHEEAWFSINISAKLLETNVNIIFERNNLEII